MTPEAQRIAIAEACGWITQQQLDQYNDPKLRWFPTLGYTYQHEGVTRSVFPVDYLSDLNAMHEAEKAAIIGTDLEDSYYCSLADDFGDGKGCTWHRGMSATAAQRAEAFLRTIGKWNETL